MERQDKDPVQNAVNDYRRALKRLGEAQDPLVQRVLKDEVMRRLDNAVVVAEASEMRERTKIGPLHSN